VRIFIDGAFDQLHYGHMNAFRLGRSLGTQLVVGVNSDESIIECKGPPLMNDQERLTMVSACKFVDEVVPGVPYIMNREYLEYVIEKYNIDFVVHGDDPCIVDGKDVYATAKQAGKFRTIPRTEGVSTTDIVGRMLLMTKDHHYHNNQGEGEAVVNGNANATPATNSDSPMVEVLGHQSKFLTTSRMLQLFSAGVQAPTAGMRVVYIDGAWDLFHPGHVAMLKVAREVRLRPR
jgi:ethanolamine-phosphate cytidylyltransferase